MFPTVFTMSALSFSLKPKQVHNEEPSDNIQWKYYNYNNKTITDIKYENTYNTFKIVNNNESRLVVSNI